MSDDFNFDDDFLFDDSPDMGKPDTPPGKVSKVRAVYNANKSILAKLGKGLLSGVKSGLQDSFPNTASLVDEVVSIRDDIASLRDDVMREIEPTLQTMSTIGARVLPKAENFIPDKVYNKLLNYLKEHGEDEDRISDETRLKRERESIISESIANAFANKMEQDTALAADDKKEQRVDRLIESKRHSELSQMLVSVDKRLASINLYIAEPMTNYFKASLELKYKHLFATSDILSNFKSSMVETKKLLTEIKHNVGLPDYVKADELKQKKSKTREYIGDRVRDLRGRFFKNVKENLLSQFEMISGVVPMLDTATSMMDSFGGGQKFTKADLFGSLGGLITSAITKSQVEKYFGKGKAKDLKNLMEHKAEDGKELFNLSLIQNAKKWSTEGGLKGFLADMILGGTSGMSDTKMSNTLFDDPTAGTTFDNITKEAIIAVIPRHLEHISSHVERLSTKLAGELKLVDRRFDHESGTLKTSGEVLKNIADRAKRASGYSEYDRTDTINKFKVAFAHTQGEDVESVEKQFEKHHSDINKLITNIAISLEGRWEPEEFKNYTPGTNITNYIGRVIKGLENPSDVLFLMKRVIYNNDGNINILANESIERAILREVKNTNPKKIAEFFDKYNMRGLAIDKGMYDQKTESITSPALHAMYTAQPETKKDTVYNVYDKDGRIVGKETSKNVGYSNLKYEYDRLVEIQESMDSLKDLVKELEDSGDENSLKAKATRFITGDHSISSIIPKATDKFQETFDSVKSKISSKIDNMFSNDEESEEFTADVPKDKESWVENMLITPKAEITVIKRISDTDTELIINEPVKSATKYTYRQTSITIKHIPIYSNNDLYREIHYNYCISVDKSNPLYRRFHSKNKSFNYFPVEISKDVKVLTDGKIEQTKYKDFNFGDDESMGTVEQPMAEAMPTEKTKPVSKKVRRKTKKKPDIDNDSKFTTLSVVMPDPKRKPKHSATLDKKVLDKVLDSTMDEIRWFRKPIQYIEFFTGNASDQLDDIGKFLKDVKINNNVESLNITPVSDNFIDEFIEYRLDFLDYSALQISLMRDLLAKDFGFFSGIGKDPVVKFMKKTGETISKTTKGAVGLGVRSVDYVASRVGKTGSYILDNIPKAAEAIKSILPSKETIGGVAKAGWTATKGIVKGGYTVGKDIGGKGLELAGKGLGGIKNFLSDRKNEPAIGGALLGLLLGGPMGAVVGGLGGKLAGDGVRRIGSAFGRAGKGIKNIFKKYIDVYEKDKIEPGKPLLSASKQKEGVFTKDGMRLKNSWSITEPLFELGPDKSINEEATLVTQEQIDNGLVDINGNDLTKDAVKKQDDEVSAPSVGKGSLLDSLGHVYKGMFGLLFGTVKTVGKATKTVIGRLFGIEGSEIKEHHKTLEEVLTKIQIDVADITRHMLPDRGDIDGDGDIDGSTADQRQKIKEAQAKREGRATGEDGKPVKLGKDGKPESGGGSGSSISGMYKALTSLPAAFKGLSATLTKIPALFSGLTSMLGTIGPALGAAALPLGIIAAGVAGSYYANKWAKEKLSESSKPMSEEEIESYRARLQGYINSGDTNAKDELDKFNTFVSREDWENARELSGMKYDKSGHVAKSNLEAMMKQNYSTRRSDDIHKLEDSSDLGKELTFIIETINKAINNCGPFSNKKREKLRMLKQKVFDYDSSELTREFLELVKKELKEIDKSSDVSTETFQASLEMEKEKETIINRRYRLLDSINIALENHKKGKSGLKSGQDPTALMFLKNRVLAVSLDELNDDLLNSFDKQFAAIDKTAVASSHDYGINKEDKAKDLEKIAKQAQGFIDDYGEEVLGFKRLKKIIESASVDPSTVNDDYIKKLQDDIAGSKVAIERWAKREGKVKNKKSTTTVEKENESYMIIEKSDGTVEYRRVNKDGSIETNMKDGESTNKQDSVLDKVEKSTKGNEVIEGNKGQVIQQLTPEQREELRRQLGGAVTGSSTTTYADSSGREYTYTVNNTGTKADRKTTPTNKQDSVLDKVEKSTKENEVEKENESYMIIEKSDGTVEYRRVNKDGSIETNMKDGESTNKQFATTTSQSNEGYEQEDWSDALATMGPDKPYRTLPDGTKVYDTHLTPEQKKQAIAALKAGLARANGRSTYNEQGYSFDANGRLVDISSGTMGSVDISSYMNGNVLHTHPGGNPLSPVDISNAHKNNLNNVMALTPDGDISVYNRKSGKMFSSHENMSSGFNTEGIESGLGDLHDIENKQVQQLDMVIQKLDTLISVMMGANKGVHDKISKAAMSTFEAASRLADVKIKAATAPRSLEKTISNSELKITKTKFA